MVNGSRIFGARRKALRGLLEILGLKMTTKSIRALERCSAALDASCSCRHHVPSASGSKYRQERAIVCKRRGAALR